MSSFPSIQLGDNNKYVKYLQYGLHIKCFKVKPFDGIFGEVTKEAVIKYQKLHNLDSNGIVDNKTWLELNKEISSIQSQLKNKGYESGSVDGIAGEKTLEAVVKFQKDKGLDADGMVGEKTLNLLFDSSNDNNTILKKGSNEKDLIITLQNLLIKKGYKCIADGNFGDNTYKAVISFQSDNKLQIDGIVGKSTWELLKSDSKPSNTNTNNNNNQVSSDKASASLIYFVKNMEGYSPSVYKDAVNVKTLGYGLTGKEIEGLNNISEETVTKLLTKYINDNYFSKVLSIIKSKGVQKPLQREVDAFTSFAYNLGVNAFESSTLFKKYINGERGDSIRKEFIRWVHAGGKVLNGLVVRRNNEWKIFSGSNEVIPGYNSKPNINIINSSNGLPSGKLVTDNNGYGAKPY